jgi:hypothetical protein
MCTLALEARGFEAPKFITGELTHSSLCRTVASDGYQGDHFSGGFLSIAIRSRLERRCR